MRALNMVIGMICIVVSMVMYTIGIIQESNFKLSGSIWVLLIGFLNMWISSK